MQLATPLIIADLFDNLRGVLGAFRGPEPERALEVLLWICILLLTIASIRFPESQKYFFFSETHHWRRFWRPRGRPGGVPEAGKDSIGSTLVSTLFETFVFIWIENRTIASVATYFGLLQAQKIKTGWASEASKAYEKNSCRRVPPMGKSFFIGVFFQKLTKKVKLHLQKICGKNWSWIFCKKKNHF